MNKILMHMTTVAALVMAMAPLAVRAEPDAGVVGTGTPASCDSNALQTMLNGGGLVTFNCGAAPHTIISNTYIISVNTVVDGAKLISLNGENLRQHFRVQPGVSLTLRNINLINGSQPQGGSIYNQGTLIIESVAFTNNTTSNDGGAIFNTATGTVIINGASFQFNKAPLASGYGGAISNAGVLSVTGVNFFQNEARFGGAIFTGGSSVVSIATSVFNANKAQLFGGGIYMNNDSSAVSIINAAFSNNTARQGAGINRGGGALSIAHASFTDNAASGAGAPTPIAGGMYIQSLAGTVRISNTTFAGNTVTSGQGGGIYNRGLLELVNVTMRNNANNIFHAGAGEKTDVRNSAFVTNVGLNCDGDGTNVTSGGNNFANDNSCALNAPTDQKGDGLDAKLNLGVTGFTTYYPPLDGSPLIDKGANCPTFDQRFAVRFNTCDVGAVEAGGATPRSLVPIVTK